MRHVPTFRSSLDYIQRAVELLRDSLDAFDVPGEDADAVVQPIAAYEENLLARPDDTEKE